jgi:CheY-like chemotaxis protein
MHMPVMDGLVATQKIKLTPQGRKTIVIALTASALGEDRRAVSESGADDFLSKPCHEDELLERMRQLLNLTFEYQEAEAAEGLQTGDVSPLTAKQLEQLPRELIDAIRDATLTGNKKLLNKLTQQVHSGGHPESAQGLQALADRYDYDTLTQLLEEVCGR